MSTNLPPDKDPKRKLTTDVMRQAARLLETMAAHAPYLEAERVEMKEVSEELRLRAIWIERGKDDPAIPEERRKGIAAIEGGEGGA